MNRVVKTLVKEKVPLNTYKVTWLLYLEGNLTATYISESVDYISGIDGNIKEDIREPNSWKYSELLYCENNEFVLSDKIIKSRISSKVIKETKYVDIYQIEEYEDDISIFGKLRGSKLMYRRYEVY